MGKPVQKPKILFSNLYNTAKILLNEPIKTHTHTHNYLNYTARMLELGLCESLKQSCKVNTKNMSKLLIQQICQQMLSKIYIFLMHISSTFQCSDNKSETNTATCILIKQADSLLHCILMKHITVFLHASRSTSVVFSISEKLG